MSLAWTAPTDDGGSTVTGYRIYRGTTRGAETLLASTGGGATGYTDGSTSYGTTYYYEVSAVNGAGESLRSNELGATPVPYGERLVEHVREITPRGNAVMDAAGRDALPAAIELAGGTERVITLSDPRAQELGVRLSAPTPDRAPRAVDEGMALLAADALYMKQRRELPLQQAAEAHRLLESGETHDKIVLSAP